MLVKKNPYGLIKCNLALNATHVLAILPVFSGISGSNKTVFLDDNIRILSFDEIINAEKELHVDFKSNQIIPLVDCGENDFIVYHFFDKIWSKFNIVDETVFKKKNSLQELLI